MLIWLRAISWMLQTSGKANCHKMDQTQISLRIPPNQTNRLQGKYHLPLYVQMVKKNEYGISCIWVHIAERLYAVWLSRSKWHNRSKEKITSKLHVQFWWAQTPLEKTKPTWQIPLLNNYQWTMLNLKVSLFAFVENRHLHINRSLIT